MKQPPLSDNLTTIRRYAEQGVTWVRTTDDPHLPFPVCFMEKPLA